jgi:hypothetical protein
MNLLIPRCFEAKAAQFREFLVRRNIGSVGVYDKRFHWRTFNLAVVYQRGRMSSGFEKESQNGLEDPKDRRSAGRHGNQHVCVRRPQVSGRTT